MATFNGFHGDVVCIKEDTIAVSAFLMYQESSMLHATTSNMESWLTYVMGILFT